MPSTPSTNITNSITAPPAGVTTRASQINFYAAQLANLKGTYQGSEANYKGQTWSQLYRNLAASYPNDPPSTLASSVLGLYAVQGVATGVGATVGGLGNFVTATGKAAVATLGGGSSSTAAAGTNCLIKFPGISIPVIGSIGGGCLFTKTEARALVGGLITGAGGVILLVSGILMVAYGLTNTSLGKGAMQSAKTIGKVASVAAV